MNWSDLEKNGLYGLIYDCDGVMIDSAEANRIFYNLVLGGLGLPPMSREMEEYAFMATARQALMAMVPAKLHDKIEDAIRSNVHYEKDVLPHVKLMPGFREFVEMAKKRGFAQAIDTNRTTEGIWHILDFFGLQSYFDPVICASNAAPKPSPEGAEKICRQWGAAPGSVLFVGDSANDMEAARGADTVFVAFGNRALPTDLHAASFECLGRMLDRIPAKKQA